MGTNVAYVVMLSAAHDILSPSKVSMHCKSDMCARVTSNGESCSDLPYVTSVGLKRFEIMFF